MGPSLLAKSVAGIQEHRFSSNRAKENPARWLGLLAGNRQWFPVKVFGSPGKIRTYDQRINSPLRYRCATGEWLEAANFTEPVMGGQEGVRIGRDKSSERASGGIDAPDSGGGCVCSAETDAVTLLSGATDP